MMSEKICKNCEYGEYARELCGFYPVLNREKGCDYFKEEKKRNEQKNDLTNQKHKSKT